MKHFAKKVAVEAHRYQWGILAKDPSMSKLDACVLTTGQFELRSMFSGTEYPVNHCFLCEYAQQALRRRRGMPSTLCGFCPVSWPEGRVCGFNDSLHTKWVNASEPEELSELAAQIRDVPVLGVEQ